MQVFIQIKKKKKCEDHRYGPLNILACTSYNHRKFHAGADGVKAENATQSSVFGEFLLSEQVFEVSWYIQETRKFGFVSVPARSRLSVPPGMFPAPNPLPRATGRTQRG